MNFKLIVNADDFGPIDFINEGIYASLAKGQLDSAQVLVNMDPGKLKTNLKRLHSFVPADRTFDLGVHFTLTSGAPITGGTNKGNIWGEMIEVVDGETRFKDYSKFHFGYSDYLQVIEDEFITQRNTLIELVDEVNSEIGKSKLVVNSVSNHHNLFTIAPDLFEVYVKVAENNPSKPLKIRSPKASPYKTIKNYYDIVLPLKNFSDSKSQRKLMDEMCFNFSNNKYTESKAITIESPAYIDIDFYKGLGSLGIGDLSKNKVQNREKKFKEMIKRASIYKPNVDIEPSQAIVEFVFHLGARGGLPKDMPFEDMIDGYQGVTHKYFDNRQTELLVLDSMSKVYGDLIKTKVSWDECGKVTYRQAK